MNLVIVFWSPSSKLTVGFHWTSFSSLLVSGSIKLWLPRNLQLLSNNHRHPIENVDVPDSQKEKQVQSQL